MINPGPLEGLILPVIAVALPISAPLAQILMRSMDQVAVQPFVAVARAKGMTQLAKETGLGRESLYKALSGEGNPSFGTILKVMHALGIKLHPEIAHA